MPSSQPASPHRRSSAGVICQRPSFASVVNASAAIWARPLRWPMEAAMRGEPCGDSPSQNSPVGTSARAPHRSESKGPPYGSHAAWMPARWQSAAK